MSKAFKRISYLHFSPFFEGRIQAGKYEKLRRTLKQAGYDISLRAYLGIALFCSLLIGISLILALYVGFLWSVINNEDFLPPVDLTVDFLTWLFAPLIIGIIFGIITLYCFYFWPNLKISDRVIQIDSVLPTVTSYMSAMASAGVGPVPIFASLAKEDIHPEITKEIKRINRDLEILGLDILKALTAAAYRSPSEHLSTFLEGINATITSGGDLTFYFATETKNFMKLREEETKGFIDQLGVLAEIFMVLGVVTPLFFVVMVAIISVIQTANEAPLLILLSITYAIVPLLMIVMLVLVSTLERPE